MDTLRKFGLQCCDLPTTLWNVTVLLRALTLNIDKRCTKRIPFIFYVLSAVVSICYIHVYLVSMLWFVFIKCPETGDLVSAMIVFSLGIASEIAVSKLFFIFLYKDVIQNIVEAYLACDSAVVPGRRFSKNLMKSLRVVKKRAIIVWMLIVSNGFLYSAKPLILPGRHFMEDSLIIYGLEPMFESPNYEIAYCITLCGVIFTCYLSSNINAFLIVLTGYTEAQMLALSDEMIELWTDAEKFYEGIIEVYENNEVEFKNKVMNAFIKGRLAELAKIHATNVFLIGEMETVFRGAIVTEFALLVIALIAELLGGLENTYLEVPFALMQVSMDCLIGQRVMDASVTFEKAVYDCKWENFDSSNMKTVLLMLQNSQKTLTLSAGGITTLSFTTLMSVLKSIYSVYTTLRSTMDVK